MSFYTGTPGNDYVVGTDSADSFEGKEGNDTFLGGKGVDTVLFAGGSAGYRIGIANGYVEVADIDSSDGNLGTDHLLNAEFLGIGGLSYGIATHAGQRPSGPTQLTLTPYGQCESAVTGLADGGYVVTWQSLGQNGGTGHSVYAQRYDSAGAAIGQEVRIDTTLPGYDPSPKITALKDGGYIVAWLSGMGLCTQRFDMNSNRVGSETVVGPAESLQDVSIASLDDGGYVLTFLHAGSGAFPGTHLYARHYDASGFGPSEILVDDVAGFTGGSFSSTGLADNGYIVTWNTSGGGVFAQRFDHQGNAVGVESLVNTSFGGANGVMAATLADDSYVITWVSSGPAGLGLYARHFDASGNALDPVQTYLQAWEGSTPTAIAALEHGGYVILWESADGFRAQRFDADGNLRGSQNWIDVDAPTTFQPAITALEDGGYLITWTGIDGVDENIFSQRFNENGKPFKEIALDITGTVGDDLIIGGKGEQWLYGQSGNDILRGGNGMDMLFGGGGRDVLTGGQGADAFVFNASPPDTFSQNDLIQDFASDDTIQLGAAFNLPSGTLATTRFVVNASGQAMDADDRIVYESDTGKLFYDSDGKGANVKMLFAIVGSDSHPVLTADDFVVI